MKVLIKETKDLGYKTLRTSFKEGKGSPLDFYQSLGSNKTGEILFGDTVIEIAL